MYPVLAYIGGFEIKSYYVFNALGIIAGFLTLFLNLKHSSAVKRRNTITLAAFIFIPFILGSKIGFVLDSIIMRLPVHVSDFYLNSGFSLWWGMAFSIAASLPAVKMLKLDIWESADLLALPISIGAVFVRLACLLNGCCFGRPCPADIPAAFFADNSPAGSVFPGKALYPVQLYEAAAWLGIFLTLNFLKNKKLFHGELILIMLIIYSAARFFIELFRYHETVSVLSNAQVWCIICFAASVFFFFRFIKETHKPGQMRIK